jgi:mannonate dehydratase
VVKDIGPVEPEEAMDADTMWERLLWFLERIVPTAEEVGVRLALHPHDPPTPWLRGEARIIGTIEGLQRLIEEVPSPVNGLNFCQGTIAEMGADVVAAIHWFGERDRINHVHFRNVKGSVPRFDESFIDDGDTDMYAAMRAYHEVGYRYAMMPDHTPAIAGDTPWGHRGRAYALGYMRALMEAVAAGS